MKVLESDYGTETLKLGFPSLPKEIKVPYGTNDCANFILRRFYEPMKSDNVNKTEINGESLQGQYRSPEFCYGFGLPGYGGVKLFESSKRLNHTLDLMAQKEISHYLAKDLVKLLVAQNFAETFMAPYERGQEKLGDGVVIPEVGFSKPELDEMVGKTWNATMQ